jgi:hypothetical protein
VTSEGMEAVLYALTMGRKSGVVVGLYSVVFRGIPANRSQS